MTPSPQNILKLRAQLAGQGQNLPQVQAPVPDQISPGGTGSPNELPFALQNTLNASIDKPQPISPREAALSQYRQAMQEQAPPASNYHPSLVRRILGSLIGGASAFDPNFVSNNPMSQLGHDFVYSPYDKATSDYQKRLAQKKQIYETESSAESQEAKTEEQKAQKEAEAARAGAEEARRKGEEWKVSSPGQEFAIRLAEAKRRAATPKESKLYNVTLKNGKNVTVTRDASGQLMMLDGTPLGDKAYDASTLREVGTTLPKDPKEESEKNRNEYNDFATGMKTKNPDMTDDDIARSWTDYKAQESAKYEKPPQTMMISPEGVAQRVTPGSHVAPGSVSPSGESTENVDTAPTRQMQETAPKVIDLVDRTIQLIDQQIKSLGPAASRWSEFMAGKVGAPNPEFTRLRTNAALLQTLLLRMHIGSRGGQQIMQHFKDLIDTSKQSPENLKAALEEIKAYAQDVGKSSKKSKDSGTNTETNVLPGGITLDDINAEIERIKKSNAK